MPRLRQVITRSCCRTGFTLALQTDLQVYLDDLDPEAVRIELYANGVDGCAAVSFFTLMEPPVFGLMEPL
jgi:hypothetical protein